MSITTELRERIDDESLPLSTRRELWNIADRIDAEHEKAAAGCIHYDPERHYCAVHGDTEHGWVRLPVDADGVPIHVGDRINVYQAKNVEVVGVGDQVVFTHYYMGDYHKHFAGDCRHHTPPTVEDVLTELEGMRGNGKTYEDVVMRCADLAGILRELLAGEGE